MSRSRASRIEKDNEEVYFGDTENGSKVLDLGFQEGNISSIKTIHPQKFSTKMHMFSSKEFWSFNNSNLNPLG